LKGLLTLGSFECPATNPGEWRSGQDTVLEQ
jgi:hypothetical protein